MIHTQNNITTMKITTKELENIFSAVDFNLIFGSKPIFVSFNETNENVDENWQEILKNYFAQARDPNQFYAVNLSISRMYYGINNILLIIRPKEVTAEFIKQIDDYISLEPNILEFLENQWRIKDSSYPLTFFWRKSWWDESTSISYRAVAPAYQNKKLNTNVSLGLIKQIAESSEKKGEHTLNSITKNPHTYSFFYRKNEKDKPDFTHQNKINVTCAEVLQKHQTSSEKHDPEDKSPKNSINSETTATPLQSLSFRK